MSARRVVIVGGGVTGLTLAYLLGQRAADVAVTLIEARSQLGGNIVTEQRDGFLIDAGPDSFVRTKPDALALCRELGLEHELCSTRPEARRVYVVHQGRLELLPGGMALAVPTRLGPLLSTPLLSLAGKLRAGLEPFVPARRGSADESITSFFSRRLGVEVSEQIAAPLLGGIFAGDAASLSIDATFPQLVELERKHGSLLRGLFAAQLARGGWTAPDGGSFGARARRIAALVRWLRRAPEDADSPFQSLRGGMSVLIEALAARLAPGSVRLGTRARGLERAIDGWRVALDDGSALAADAVVLAGPAHVSAELVPDPGLRDELAAIPYGSSATVFFAFARAAVAHPLDATGFISPASESRLLAATFVSSKWEGRAPPGHVLLRAFLGGERDADRLRRGSDAELVDFALVELRRLLGRLDTPLFTRVFRHERASPQPRVGHVERMRRVATRVAALPGVYLAGSAYDGVGIPDCVRQARRLAAELVPAHGVEP